MDVKYIPTDWDIMRSGLSGLLGEGWSSNGLFDHLKDLNEVLEEAERDIAKYDVDGAISFHHASQKSLYNSLSEEFSVLHRFTGKVGGIVDRTIDDPFYKDMDVFVQAVRDLSISNYTTGNRIGAKEMMNYGYGATATQMEVTKTEVSIDDLLSGGNFYSDQIKQEYENWKTVNPDQEISEEEYRMAAVNMRAFEYESIQDRQENKEFWVQMAALVVIIGVSVVCPVAGLALGAVYGTLELDSAVKGKDWVTGRELDMSERWIRGLLSPLDIIPGVKAIGHFSDIARVGRVSRVSNRAIDSGISGIHRIKKTVSTDIATIQRLFETSDRAMTARLQNAQQFFRKAGNRTLDKLAKDATDLARIADAGINSTRHGLSRIGEAFQPLVSADGVGLIRAAPEDIHTNEDIVRAIVGKRGDLNLTNRKIPLNKTPSTNGFINKMDKILGKYGKDIHEFNEIKLKPMDQLTDAEVSMMKDIRGAVPGITDDTSLQKTIPESDIGKYLNGLYSEIGGYVAKLDDVGHIRAYNDVVESSRLDYTTWDGSRPFPEDGRTYGKIEFTSNDADHISIPYGERFGGTNTDGYPCTLNGFTASRNGEVIPEWIFDGRYFPNDGAKLYRVTDGIEELVGVFDIDLKVFVPVK